MALNGSSISSNLPQLHHSLYASDDPQLNATTQANGSSHIDDMAHTNGATHASGTSQNGGVGPSSPTNPIAICGMALRLPGGAETPEEFWDFLLAKRDARIKVPETRFNASMYHSDLKGPGSVATQYGYFLDESIKLGSLDASRFSMSRAELEYADPQQRRLLEVVREAFDDAGDIDFRGASIGCYIGNFGEDWLEMMNKDPLTHGPYKVEGCADFMISNRISYEFDLKGPSMVIRTACSSSLIGLHEACNAIEQGQCESAIVGGCNLIMAPGMTQKMSEKGVLSPEGSCKTFSADADGYARGEAVTAIYVKPLNAAIRDGNPVRAVIRGISSNDDGRTLGITAPNGEAHEAMIRKTYQLAGITDFSKTAYFECHGTGTSVGDPIEANAVARIFGDEGIHITSVKPNVGHTEGASGLVSLIKAVMSLENRTIPPNIKFNTPNPKIPFKERKLTVPVDATPFPEGRHERVSVNSFGVGGSNAHVILDSADSYNVGKKNQMYKPVADAPQLLLFSASTAPSLKKMTGDFEEWLRKRPGMADRIDDVAYTLANRREHLTNRAFKIFGKKESATSLGRRIPAQAMNLVMVFTGQGAQWPRMGRELMLRDDLCYQETIKRLDQYLQKSAQPPEWTIEEELQKPPRSSRVQKADFSQPLCTAIQIGLVDLFASLGIKPAAVVGHSSGELAAAYAAGALTAEEAILGAYQRGQAAKLQNKKGAMAAVGLGWAEVEKFLDTPKVVVACENSPNSVTLSGDIDDVQAALSRIREEYPEIAARLLKVEKAYHSYHMREIGRDYYNSIQPHLTDKRAVKPFFSSVTGTGKPEERLLDAKYWQQNLESPVLFNNAVSGILETIKNPAFFEIGPHGALAGPLRQIFAAASATPPYLAAMNRNEDCVESYLQALGSLFELNIFFDVAALIPNGVCLPDLPRYPWNHESEFWIESRMSQAWRNPQFKKHPLLGQRALESTDLEPSFRSMLHLDDIPWLRDHKVEGNVTFPCAAYIALVGEAMRQVSGAQNAYVVERLVLSTALVLDEGVEVEMVTSFRPHRLTETLDSQMWDFTIASYNGRIWTKHCTGIAGAGPSEPTEAEEEAPLPRKCARKRVYEALTSAGLEFGHRFQRLDNIRCGTIEKRSTCGLTEDYCGDEEYYHIHPTVIDAALQSGLVASRNGRLNASNSRGLPTLLEKVTVFRSAHTLAKRVTSTTRILPGSGEVIGRFRLIADSKVVLDMDETHLTPLEEAQTINKNHLPITARVTWNPHINFLDPNALIKPEIPREIYTPMLDEMGKLSMVYTLRHINYAKSLSQTATMQHYTAWIGQQVAALDPTLQMHALDDTAIIDRLNDLANKMSASPVAGCADSLIKVVKHIGSLLSGETEALELLLADDTLTNLYVSTDAINRTEFIRTLAHSRANLRVLEIGAGTGASSASMLNDLFLPLGHPLYTKYTFTDISSGFFVAAKQRFQDTPNIEYRVLDISKDPAEQGFKDDKYDLIVATNVIHATKNLNETLCNVRKLMAPEGRFLLHELHSPSKWMNFIFGLLDGWWYGAPDGRPEEPYVTPERWEVELKRAGFEGLDAVVLDSEEPYQLNAIMVAKPLVENPRAAKKCITILHNEEDLSSTMPLVAELQNKGYVLDICRLGESLPQFQDIVALLDQTTPFLENISEENFKALQKVLDILDENTGLLWVTQLSQMHCQSPRYAQVIGAARSIRNEALVDFATVEVDDFASSAGNIAEVFEYFHARVEDEWLKCEYEYAIVNGIVYVGRVYPFSLEDESAVQGADELEMETQVALVAEKPGRLTSLRWVAQQPKELVYDQVEVAVYATGLNFKDVLEALGVIPYPEGGMGVDSSGIVSKIGPNVTDIAVGDRVMCLGSGNFASHLVTPATLCEKIPENVSFEEAATMPAVYSTVIECFQNVGNLQLGQSVLIHSACGGVGIAALHLALAAGATVYATVSSEAKVQYLMQTFRLPRNRIFNSRNASFVEDIMRETNGVGVDLALNSLSGELLHATWKCVAEFGRMVEIGKTDLIGAGKLDLEAFLGSRGYSGVYLDALMARRRKQVKTLLRSTVDFLSKGIIAPITPRTVYDASTVQEAFRYMQQGQHMGKIVVTIRHPDGTLKVAADSTKLIDTFTANPSASYLLVGGLGGIGRAVARHLVEYGARHLVFLSRSAGSRPEDADTVVELESMGCVVKLVKGSVVSRYDVLRAVQQAPNLKGILQCSMVLRDEAFSKMSLDEWTTAVNPKVAGTWNLHEVTLECGIKLDFFVMLSSMSGLTGTPGQANYSGANTFLDAFAQYRNNLGLAAASVDLSAVSDMGYVSLDEMLLQRMIKGGSSGVTEKELLDAISAAMKYPTKSLVSPGNREFTHRNTIAIGFSSIIPLHSPENRSWWKKDTRMAAYHNISDATTDKGSSDGNTLQAFLAETKNDTEKLRKAETAAYLAVEIGKQLLNLLLKPEEDLDASLPVSQLGLDSLVGIEMRNWWRKTFGFDISVLQLLGLGTLEGLGKHAAEGLVKALEASG